MKKTYPIILILTILLISLTGCSLDNKIPQSYTNSIGQKFTYVKPGSFMMGSNSGNEFEKPAHSVALTQGFYIQTTEVTQGQWYDTMGTKPWLGPFPKEFANKTYVQDNRNNPAVYISWNEAKKFIKKLNEKEEKQYRLPTEAEWEYACRAGSQSKYSFGDNESQLQDYAWYSKNSWGIGEKYAHPVAKKKPNAWGLYDMHGNVYELCEDFFDKYLPYSATNPKGLSPIWGGRVIRGCSLVNSAETCNSTHRFYFQQKYGSYEIGFRLVMNSDESKISMKKSNKFITTWDTRITHSKVKMTTTGAASARNQIRLPLSPDGTYNFEIEWGDGTKNFITKYNQPETTHTYAVSGVYNVEISGQIEDFGFSVFDDDYMKLLDVKNWGNVKLGNMGYQFAYTDNLQGFSATDLPDLSHVTDMHGMFLKSVKFNQDIGNWDVSNVRNMRKMFYKAKAFNQDIGDWDVSGAIDMSDMFKEATAFNQNIGDWDVSGVIDMSSMFREAVAFNQTIGEWDVSNVKNMCRMFYKAKAFNQDIGDWEITNITDISRMFYKAKVFNQNLEGWDIRKVKKTDSMFHKSGMKKLPSWYKAE